MKAQIIPLNKKAAAKVPLPIADHKSLHRLSPLAYHLLLYVDYLYHQRDYSSKMPSKRTTEDYTFSMRLRDLQAHLKPGSTGSLLRRDYRYLQDAVGELSTFQVIKESSNVKGKRRRKIINLLCEVDYSEEGAELTYILSPSYQKALETLKEQGIVFRLIPLGDAFALSDTRQLQMLSLACKVLKLRAPIFRRLSVGKIREHFGLTGPAYAADWKEVWRKLKLHAEAVSKQTNYKVTLTPIADKQDRRRVAFVQIDSRLRSDKPAPLALPAPTVSAKPKPRIAAAKFNFRPIKKSTKPKPRISRWLTPEEQEINDAMYDDDMAKLQPRAAGPAKAPRPLYEKGTCYDDVHYD